MGQVTSIHDIALILVEYSGLSTRKVDSLAPRGCDSNYSCVTVNSIWGIDTFGTFCGIGISRMPQNPVGDSPALVEAVIWASVNSDLFRYMASLGHNDLIWKFARSHMP